MSQHNVCHNGHSYALIAMGSNEQSAVGCPKTTLNAAISHMEDAGISVDSLSNFYNTPSFPKGSGPDFVNAAVKVRSDGDAASLLRQLHRTEAAFGRERIERWSSRPLDLDLLAFGQTVLPNDQTVQRWIDLPLEQQKQSAPSELLLPHPRIQDRSFVLVPLADIAPDWRHPILGKTVLEMLQARPIEEIEAVKPAK